jgi:hypothetical protein
MTAGTQPTAEDGGDARVLLVDRPDDPRTTASLLASLAARLGALQVTTGAVAVGSLVAGFCVLGRQVSRTVEGARVRRALETARAGSNGALVWSALRLDGWLSSVPPSPVLDQLRNDVALLLAGDLEETVGLFPITARAAGENAVDDGRPATFLDCAVGLWAYARELATVVDAIVAPTLPPPSAVVVPDEPPPEAPGAFLR